MTRSRPITIVYLVHEAILLIGPTGSGKTPLGDLLAERGLRGWPCHHFDFGRNLRRVARAERPPKLFSLEELTVVRQVLESGALLEDRQFPIAAKILQAFLDEGEISEADAIVLNGLPRHAGQARDVDSMVRIETVVHLACSAEGVHERIRTDAGGDRAQRSDDSVEEVRARLAVFQARTTPLIDHYRGRGVEIVNVSVDSTTTAQDAWGMLQDR